jgi:hypothetical protein
MLWLIARSVGTEDVETAFLPASVDVAGYREMVWIAEFMRIEWPNVNG